MVKTEYFLFPQSRILNAVNMSKCVLESDGCHVTRTTKETVIYLLTEGRMEFESNGEHIVMLPGDVRIFNVGEYQRPLKAGHCKYYYLHFAEKFKTVTLTPTEEKTLFAETRKRFLKSVFSDFSAEHNLDEIYLPKSFSVKDSPLLKRIYTCFKNGDLSSFSPKENYYNLNTNLCGMQALVLFNRACCEEVLKPEGFFNEATADLISKYLNAHLQNKITGKELGSVFGYNFDYMNRKFKEITSKTIYNYLQELRISQAKLLLYTKTTSITDIARLTGFCDVYHFSKTFKKICKMTPTEFMNSGS